MRVRGGPERLLRKACRRGAADVRLQMAAAGARALAGKTVELDHHVAELRPTAVELSVEHDATTAARAEREHHHRL